MSNIIYVPLEAYTSRYTEFTSAEGGAYETQFNKYRIAFGTIRPDKRLRTIAAGCVLDPFERTAWSFSQIMTLQGLMRDKRIVPGDNVYFEDFWHPGFEQIPYTQHLLFGGDADRRNHIATWSFCHAQSTDPFDFTHPMAYWMRGIEKGWATYMSGIFCAAKEMVFQWRAGGLPYQKLIPVGHMWDAEAVVRITDAEVPDLSLAREDAVVFSSRFDSEKNPIFFIEVAEKVLALKPSTKFIFCSGLPYLSSNDPMAISAMGEFADRHPDNVVFKLGLTKRDYYKILSRAKVQFNCADQDFISYTLLEAALFNCQPLYPRYLTFPDALNRHPEYLYNHKDVSDAAHHCLWLLTKRMEDTGWICQKHETTGARMLKAMGYPSTGVLSIQELNEASVTELKEIL